MSKINASVDNSGTSGKAIRIAIKPTSSNSTFIVHNYNHPNITKEGTANILFNGTVVRSWPFKWYLDTRFIRTNPKENDVPSLVMDFGFKDPFIVPYYGPIILPDNSSSGIYFVAPINDGNNYGLRTIRASLSTIPAPYTN